MGFGARDLVSKNDTNIIGSIVAGNKVIADIGGDLNIQTLQERERSKSSDVSFGGSVTIGVGVSASVYGGYNSSDSDYLSAKNQAGILAGDHRFDININGTGTASSWGNLNSARPSFMTASDSSNSQTKSGISAGNITITNAENQAKLTGKTPEEMLALLNRDVLTGWDKTNALDKIYDEASIKASFEITNQLNTEVGIYQANRAAERAKNEKTIKDLEEKAKSGALSDAEAKDLSTAKASLQSSEKWAMGGTSTLALNAISLAANGNVTGSAADLIRDSAVNYLQGLAAQEIKKLGDQFGEAARTALHAIASCAGAAAKQGSCSSAALAGGASVVLNIALDNLLKINSKDMDSLEKDARVNLITSLIAGITQAAGGDAALANAASRIEMENNHLASQNLLGWQIGPNQIEGFAKEMDESCKTNLDTCATTYEKWQKLSYKQRGMDTEDQQTDWQNFVGAAYESVYAQCEGNQNCINFVDKQAITAAVVFAGDAEDLKNSVRALDKAFLIEKGKYISLGLDALNDFGWIPVSQAIAPIGKIFQAGNKVGSVKVTAQELDNFLDAANVAHRGGLTAAGRALKKHSDRVGSTSFPKSMGNQNSVNKQAQQIVENILNDPNKTVLRHNMGRYGNVTDVVAPNGLGVRYGSDGKLIGFLEP